MHRSSILLCIVVIGICFKSNDSVCVTRRRPVRPFLPEIERPREHYSIIPDNSDNPRVPDESGYRPDNPRVPDESGYRPDNPRVPDESGYRPDDSPPQPATETPRTTQHSTLTTALIVTSTTTTAVTTAHPTTTTGRMSETSRPTTTTETTTETVRTTRQVSTAGCPNGFYRFGQYCYYVSPADVYDSIEKAQSHCKNTNSKATLLDLGMYTSQDRDQLNNFFASGLCSEYAFPVDVTYDDGASKYKWSSNKQQFDCSDPIKFQYCATPLSENPFVWVGASNPFEIENTYIFSYTQIVCQLKV